MSSRLRAVLMTGGERKERDDMSSSTNGGSAQAVAEKVGEETGLNAISKHSRRKGSKSVVVAIGPAVASATVRSARIMRRIAHVTSSRTFGALFNYGDTTGVDGLSHVLFLLSNVAFPVAGVSLIALGGVRELALGAAVLLAGFASHIFHASQVRLGPNRLRVKIALGFDYMAAISAGMLAFKEAVEVIEMEGMLPPIVALLAAIAGACFIVSSVRTRSLTYIVTHAMWHIMAASTALALGLHHAALVPPLLA